MYNIPQRQHQLTSWDPCCAAQPHAALPQATSDEWRPRPLACMRFVDAALRSYGGTPATIHGTLPPVNFHTLLRVTHSNDGQLATIERAKDCRPAISVWLPQVGATAGMGASAGMVPYGVVLSQTGSADSCAQGAGSGERHRASHA